MNQETSAKIERFRRIAFWEGLSYVILLFVAMPLKHFFGYPMAVSIVGMAHGILFILYVLFLLLAHQAAGWSMTKSGGLFLWSLVPFAPFFVDRSLREEAKQA